MLAHRLRRASTAQGVLSLALVDSFVQADNKTVDLSGYAAGDICLIWQYLNEVTPEVNPSGFTRLRGLSLNGAGSSDATIMVSAKVLDGTETTVVGMQEIAQEADMAVAVFHPSVPVSSFTDHDTGNAQATTGNPTAQTISTGGATEACLAYGQMSTGDLTTISPRTAAGMAELTTQIKNYAHYKVFNDSFANITYDMDDEGACNLMYSGWLSFTLA